MTSIDIAEFWIWQPGFCHRVGFGKDIETAEAERARRFGLKRESTWRSQRSIRAEEE